MEMTLPDQLDKVLEWFYASVCKQDGTKNEPGFFRAMQAAFNRHLKEKGFFSFLLLPDHSVNRTLVGFSCLVQRLPWFYSAFTHAKVLPK